MDAEDWRPPLPDPRSLYDCASRRMILRPSQRPCVESQIACVRPPLQSQLTCARKQPRLRVEPYIIARRYTLESFLVRRLICDVGTRGYGTLFLKALATVAEADPTAPVASVLRQFLAAGQSAANLWPDDEAFERSWCSKDLYAGRGARPLMILCALEDQEWRSDHLAMPIASFDWSKVQVEHVMPQGWKAHWPLNSEVTADERDTTIQRIGNLTLVSEALNPSLSNGPWLAKRVSLGKHAHLRLTTAFTSKETWDEAAINARSLTLFGLAKAIWPRPSVNPSN